MTMMQCINLKMSDKTMGKIVKDRKHQRAGLPKKRHGKEVTKNHLGINKSDVPCI